MATQHYPFKRAIPVTAVWLRRIGKHAEVLVEVDGRGWVLAIREYAENNYGHIAEAVGVDSWPPDPIAPERKHHDDDTQEGGSRYE